MRIAILSDIHGNCVALDAVLAELQSEPIDGLVCLGDAVQGGPQPAQVVARLRETACRVVMGNADTWLLTGQASDAEQIAPARQRKMDEVRTGIVNLSKFRAIVLHQVGNTAIACTTATSVGGPRALFQGRK